MTSPETGLVPVVHTVADLRAQVSAWKSEGLRVGLVPTMGALHHGHLSLVDAIAGHVDRVVVSIFVNPTQFGEGEDLDKYPRQMEADRKALSDTPASLIFAPTVEEMYPGGFASTVSVKGVTEGFEGALRPGHFDGVATIVTKLLMQCGPDVAIFGEKDYQQLAVIRRFVADLDIPVEILGGALIREPDGLAASSRNAYLSEDERRVAGRFNVILKDLVTAVEAGKDLRTAEAEAGKKLIEAGFDTVDYVSIVDPDSLAPLESHDRAARVLAVARLGGVRLLDNMAIGAP
ncbi:pantoate--beta-alanine ligase [Kordiimonas marina]|uniref:pantoate--beta-alanine ligase n=1 Tax=Kordiimonas marina TaxID=2872312 RepID=UPI001FF4F408|nr:pantoate--beta-alanine ligase [Kordiimonas marina]MCJ9429248.1 pantoate--beta-alanine ligase [Kordiimonas marina]